MFGNSNLYGSEWLAIVFSNRNKNYGAYELRVNYSSIMVKSLFISASLFVFLFTVPTIYNYFNPKEEVVVKREVMINTADVIHELKKEEPKKEEIRKAEPVKEKIKTVNFSNQIKVVAEPQTHIDPPTAKELENAVISTVTQDGAEGKINATSTSKDDGIGNGSAEGAERGVDDGIYNVAGVEIFPEFPGGMAAWARYIQKNLKYPSMAQDEQIQGKVFLSFVVEKDGSITDVSVLRGIGYGCDEEAMRVIKKSPKWKAGQQNNKPVRVRYTMPINYTIAP